MKARRSNLWSGGTLLGSGSRLRTPGLYLVATVLLMVALDGFLGAGIGLGTPKRDLDYRDAAGVRATLARAAADGDRAWLLLGDSVLVGDMLAGTVPDWHQHRVVDYLNAEVRPDAGETFHQVALNGLLLTDMVRIVRELDRFDPGGRVGLVVELSLRMFSPRYAEEETPTRPWLGELGRPVTRDGHLAAVPLLQVNAGALGDWFRRHAPLYRHRDLLPNPLEAASLVPLLAPSPSEVDPLEMRARMQENFRAPLLLGDFAPLRALDEILARIRAAERPALFFTPPLNRRDFGEVSTPERYGEDLAWLSRRIDAEEAPTVRLRHLDHPLFVPEHFFDLMHLFPPGNRLLALNLLHALELPFAHAPAPEELVADTDTGGSLVWQVNPGMREGPGWHAAFRAAEGIAVNRDRHLVVADTGNHVIRELDRSHGTVRVLAGQPAVPGHGDGPAAESLLESPRHPCFGEAGTLFFADGPEGARLRRFHRGLVTTEYPLEGERWSRISGLGYRNGLVYVLDEGERILAYEPRSGACALVCAAGSLQGIRAFDVTADGRLFIADGRSRIWQTTVMPETPLLFTYHPVFENTGSHTFPLAHFYPYPKAYQRLDGIRALRHVPRYNGLLILDEVVPGQDLPDFDETHHLRFLDLESGQIMPWLAATAQGGYLIWNERAETYVSPLRRGSFALLPDTARIYYLEERRSRLFSIEDGLWEGAKIAHVAPMHLEREHPVQFSNRSSENILFSKSPDRFLQRASQESGLGGPYLGLIVGPSTIAASELMPHYGLARVMERELSRRLALEHRLRFEVLVRAKGAMAFDEAILEVERFLALGGRLDVVYIAVINVGTLGPDGDPHYYLGRLARAAEHYDTQVVFFDTQGLFGRYRDGLQPLTPGYQATKALIRDSGFEVVEMEETLLQYSQRMHPVGSPPFQEHHAAPWTIEAAGRILAARLYPKLSDQVTGRMPALERFASDMDGAAAEDLLVTALESGLAAHGPFALIPVPDQAVQRRSDGRHLDMLLDLEKTPAYRAASNGVSLDHIALSVLRHALVRDVAGRRAQSGRLRLAVFRNYDEYGEGVAEGAEILWTLDLSPADLEAWIAGLDPEPPAPARAQPLEEPS